MAERTEFGDIRSAPNRRVQLAQVLALVALLAALVGALGPANDVRSTYSWPPLTLPTGTPSRIWYTPLLLIRHRPETISANVPCSLPPALREAERPLTVFATARSPERSQGLAVTRQSGRLVVGVGREVLTRIDPRARRAGSGECAYRLQLGDGRWSLEGGPTEAVLGGVLDMMPVVSGLFSALDLRRGTPPSIEVTTAVHATRPTLRQKLAWALAVLCVVSALLLSAFERRPRRPRAVITSAARAAVAHTRAADAVVAIVLLGWWVVSPVALDDGWVIARERMFAASGGFSHYYTDFGANLPNDYWLEWAQHWLAESSLLIVRLPSLLCLAVVWVLCRWILARVLQPALGESRVVLWALASSFLVGALAWGMTVRPEPVTAVFVTAVMACTVRFLETKSAAPLAAIALLIPFALSGHHAAVAALAPVLVAAPTLFRWARARVATASTIIASSIALFAVLLFIGADLEQRRTDAQRTGTSGSSDHTWADEISRYALLSDMPPLRRAAVALIGLALLAFVLQRRRAPQTLLDLPSASLGVGLILFIATPSKLPWHFGALLGIAAVAVAAETARLSQEAERSRGWQARPFLAVGAAILAIGWSWSAGRSWGVAELRTLDWTLGLEKSFSLPTLAAVLPLILLAFAAGFALIRGRKHRLHELSWSAVSWTAPLLAAPLIAFTAAVLVTDAARSEWTLARQNLGTLAGHAGCGLADDLRIAVPGSARPLAIVRRGGIHTVPAWVPPAPVEGLPRFVLGPAEDGSAARSPWFRLSDHGRVGIFVSGTPAATDLLGLEFGRLRRRAVQRLNSIEIPRGFASEAGAVLPWWFVAASELPAPPRGANTVRVTLRSDVTPGAAVAVTAPVTHMDEPLRPALEATASRSLVFTDLLMYFPCVHLPRLSGGIVEVPRYLVVSRDWPSPVADNFTSPFARVLDLYHLQRLPWADSTNSPRTFTVFGVDQQLPGAVQAPPDKLTLSS